MQTGGRIRAWALGMALWATASTAQERPQAFPHSDAQATREWFVNAYRDVGITPRAADLDRLVTRWGRATDPTDPFHVRREALRALLDEMVQTQGVPEWRYGDADLDAMAARVEEIKGFPSPPPLMATPAGPWGTPGHVSVIGEGAVPLVLISDIDYDGDVYRTFATEYGSEFTSYIVTVPGAGGTAPSPWEGRIGSTPWLENVERAVLSVVETHDLDRPVVVGVMGSAYTAARLALEHPARFRAAVVLHGLVASGLPSPIEPARPATRDERLAWVDATLPDLFPPPGPAVTRQTYAGFAGAAAIDAEVAAALTERAARTDPDVLTRYITELSATDLSPAFAALELPTLVIPSIHDARSPVGLTEFGTGQWQSLALDYPDIPITVVPFRATRNYAPVDQPHALADAIRNFIGGRSVRGVPADPALSAYQASPASEVMAVVGATEVRVSYHSPAVRGRTIWGGLVPWDRLWRAGADAATRFDVSRDIVVEGERLEAGSYSFFVTPRDRGPWTVVFNRVAIQSGAASREPRHDALSLDIPPQPAPFRERLSYSIDLAGPQSGRVYLHWADRRIGFEIEAPEATGLTRIAVADAARLETLDWRRLSVDPPGDGRSTRAPDGRSFWHAERGDTAWFRLDLHRPITPESGFGVNLVVDVDRDQATGSPWWGANSAFRYDRLVTAWVFRAGDAYWGTVGVSDAASASAADYDALASGTLAIGVDVDGRTIFIGVPARDLDDDGHMRLIAAVGTNVLWNDDLVDEGWVELQPVDARGGRE